MWFIQSYSSGTSGSLCYRTGEIFDGVQCTAPLESEPESETTIDQPTHMPTPAIENLTAWKEPIYVDENDTEGALLESTLFSVERDPKLSERPYPINVFERDKKACKTLCAFISDRLLNAFLALLVIKTSSSLTGLEDLETFFLATEKP